MCTTFGDNFVPLPRTQTLIQTRDNENVFVLRTWLGKLAMPMPSKDLAVAIGREQGDTTSKTEVVKEVSMQFSLFVFIWIVAHFQQGPWTLDLPWTHAVSLDAYQL